MLMWVGKTVMRAESLFGVFDSRPLFHLPRYISEGVLFITTNGFYGDVSIREGGALLSRALLLKL